jgi:hypothetical protein
MPPDQVSISAWTVHGDFACGHCSSPLIQPVEWTPVSAGEWVVSVRCPECHTAGSLHLSDEQVNRFRNMLDEATYGLQETAAMLDGQVFKESCKSFVQALRADQICPMDF